jgi:quinolinate synthase
MARAMTPNFIPQAGVTELGDTLISTKAENTLPVPITHPICNMTLGNDAEALTLANGTYAGQMLVIYVGTAGGGDGTITPVTATGWATAVLTAANDGVTVMWINTTVGWIILGSVGAANTPVVS